MSSTLFTVVSGTQDEATTPSTYGDVFSEGFETSCGGDPNRTDNEYPVCYNTCSCNKDNGWFASPAGAKQFALDNSGLGLDADGTPVALRSTRKYARYANSDGMASADFNAPNDDTANGRQTCYHAPAKPQCPDGYFEAEPDPIERFLINFDETSSSGGAVTCYKPTSCRSEHDAVTIQNNVSYDFDASYQGFHCGVKMPNELYFDYNFDGIDGYSKNIVYRRDGVVVNGKYKIKQIISTYSGNYGDSVEFTDAISVNVSCNDQGSDSMFRTDDITSIDNWEFGNPLNPHPDCASNPNEWALLTSNGSYYSLEGSSPNWNHIFEVTMSLIDDDGSEVSETSNGQIKFIYKKTEPTCPEGYFEQQPSSKYFKYTTSPNNGTPCYKVTACNTGYEQKTNSPCDGGIYTPQNYVCKQKAEDFNVSFTIAGGSSMDYYNILGKCPKAAVTNAYPETLYVKHIELEDNYSRTDTFDYTGTNDNLQCLGVEDTIALRPNNFTGEAHVMVETVKIKDPSPSRDGEIRYMTAGDEFTYSKTSSLGVIMTKCYKLTINGDTSGCDSGYTFYRDVPSVPSQYAGYFRYEQQAMVPGETNSCYKLTCKLDKVEAGSSEASSTCKTLDGLTCCDKQQLIKWPNAIYFHISMDLENGSQLDKSSTFKYGYKLGYTDSQALSSLFRLADDVSTIREEFNRHLGHVDYMPRYAGQCTAENVWHARMPDAETVNVIDENLISISTGCNNTGLPESTGQCNTCKGNVCALRVTNVWELDICNSVGQVYTTEDKMTLKVKETGSGEIRTLDLAIGLR